MKNHTKKEKVFIIERIRYYKMNPKQAVQKYLALADIRINGNRPWDIQVHNPKLFSRLLAGGSLALGESYMDGWWDCKELDKFICRILKSSLDKRVKGLIHLIPVVLKAKLMNLQSKSRAFEKIGRAHV